MSTCIVLKWTNAGWGLSIVISPFTGYDDDYDRYDDHDIGDSDDDGYSNDYDDEDSDEDDNTKCQ